MSSGVTQSCLNVVGNVPDVSEALITCVTAAVTVGAMDWKISENGVQRACGMTTCEKFRHTALSERGE